MTANPMRQAFSVGMAVRCIDNRSRPHWAEWYGDAAYCEDMLSMGKRYVVRAIAEQDGHIGIDVGVPTPWGDHFWNADRFEPALVREPLLARDAATHPKEGKS